MAVSAPVVQDNHTPKDARIHDMENRETATTVRDKAEHTTAVHVQQTTTLMQNTA